MGLFDKKYCDICGDKIGLLGNRKLEDGNMCKDCAKKLSPFFSDRRSSTVEEIKQQLAYREQNKQLLSGFSPMFTFGEDDKIYIDPMKQSFVVSRRNPGSWSDENPDVIPLSSVTGCNLRVDEDREELYTQGKDGEEVSYNPPRYKFTYDFYIDIKVNNPYFDEITVRLNDRDVEGMGTMEYNRYQQTAQQVINNLTQNGNAGMAMNNGYNQPMNNGMPMNQGYAPAGAYGQPNPYAQAQPNQYAQQNPYAQPQGNPYAQQNAYAQQQPNPYAQQNQYNQPMNNGYNQPMNQGYNQQPAYGQQPVSQAWVCPACNATNESGAFCACCGTPRQR
ncbi:MAG: DUF4428 domain-containing protein [Clostridia bacterium]|nr:DUF4428 domain-containing protein [Clostridia bacterium]